MASLARLAFRIHATNVTNNKWGITYQCVRNHWNKDWKPGPYPTTSEERAAAAKKYGLSPEEYRTYPDDGIGYGDYPKLPDISAENKNPYYPWDFPEHKRNFGEPIHANAEIMGEDRINVNLKMRLSENWVFLVFSVLAAIYYFFEDYKLFHPLLAKQYPKPGVVHYTFEPAA